jgi:hypothetical protein
MCPLAGGRSVAGMDTSRPNRTHWLAGLLAVFALAVFAGSTAASSPPSPTERALAQERYYESYGRAAPLVRPARAKTHHASPWPTIAVAVSLSAVAAVGSVTVARSASRRRVAAS